MFPAREKIRPLSGLPNAGPISPSPWGEGRGEGGRRLSAEWLRPDFADSALTLPVAPIVWCGRSTIIVSEIISRG